MTNPARLSTIVEGVQFEVSSDRGDFKAVVLADMLMERFGAGASPQSWLASYQANATAIRRLALDARLERPTGDWVVLRLPASLPMMR